MRKTAKILLLICGVCLTASACRPTASETKEIKKTYKELIDSIDLEKDTLSLELSDMVNINASVTPKSKYEDGLGIYEFEQEALGFDTKGFISRLNQYFGKEEVFYENSAEYLRETDAKGDEWQCKVVCNTAPQGSVAAWDNDIEMSESSSNLIVHLLANRYPIYYRESDLMEDEIKKIVHLFGDQFQNVDQGDFRYIIIDGEEGYKRIEDIYRKVDVGLKEDQTDKAFEDDLYPGGLVAKERKEVYGVEFRETIGNEKIPLISMNHASYKNPDKKSVPETSRESFGDEVWTPVDNKICGTFDSLGNLQSIYMEKYIRTREMPERVEQILDLRQVLNIIYEKVKGVKRPVNIYSIQLNYTGVVLEEGEELEDYVYPVWVINYYDSAVQGSAKIYLDAVTGREL